MDETNTKRGNRQQPHIGCILVNYRTPREMLCRCLDSIIKSRVDIVPSIVIVDNASGDGIVDGVLESYPGVEIVNMPENAGFAAAVNRGLAQVDAPYVLMLNTDAVLTPDALQLMIQAIGSAGKECAGVAPKMMSSAHQGIIDAIGTVMPPDGASFNRGIGQCDLGQYDVREEVFGVCFGAALIRRRLFEPEAVGPLYEDYFLYFEDSDWCMRARSQGYTFITEPDAVVLHLHSGITRHESLDFKYRLIELNTLKVAVRTFESPIRAARIVTARSARLLARTFIRRRFIGANLATLLGFLTGLPQLLNERRRLKRRRIVSDRAIFSFAAGEDAYFDTVRYQPHRCLESLLDTYGRLEQHGDAAAGARTAALRKLQSQAAAGGVPVLTTKDRELFDAEPECVRALLDMPHLAN